MFKNITVQKGNWDIEAQETDHGIVLMAEGECFASLEYDNETNSFTVIAYGTDDVSHEPQFRYDFKLDK